MYSRSLSQKFRIGSDFHLYITYKEIFNKLLYLIVCSNRNRRFHHYKTISFHRFRNLSGNRCNIRKICTAIRHFRCSYSDKNCLCIFIGIFIICCVMNSAGSKILFHQLLQPVFINWRNAAFHHFYFIFIYIHTGYIMSHFRKTNPCNQSHIACSCNCYFHIKIPPFYFAPVPSIKIFLETKLYTITIPVAMILPACFAIPISNFPCKNALFR